MVKYLMFIMLTGCVQHEVRAPQLDAVGDAIAKFSTQDCKPVAPRYVPKPIPQDVEITIKGDKVKANDGGVELLREFVTMKKLLK